MPDSVTPWRAWHGGPEGPASYAARGATVSENETSPQRMHGIEAVIQRSNRLSARL